MSAILDIVTKDSTDRSVTIRIIDATTGLPETAVEHNTSGIDLWYRREGGAKVSITEAALATLETAHTDGGIEHIGDGEYRLDLPDAAFATGANYVDIGGTVTGMIVIGGRVRLSDLSMETAMRGTDSANTATPLDAAGIRGAVGLASADLDTQLAAIDTAIAALNDYDGSDTAGVTTLLSRLTALRAGYIDKLNVSGTVAHSDAANTYKATGFSTHSAADVWAVVTRTLTAGTKDSEIDAINTNVSTLLTRIPAALFSGITSMAQWLGLMSGKQTGNATALTEIRATGAGSGTYDPTTDSLEAIRDRGDNAWITGSGGASSSTSVTTIARALDDTEEIRFIFPTDGVAAALNTNSQVAVNETADTGTTGTITQLNDQAGLFVYQLAYNAADRPTSGDEGYALYTFTDGTSTRYVRLVQQDVGGGGDGDATEEKQDQIIASLSGGQNVTNNNPVASTGEVTIYAGAEYSDTDGLALSWSITNYSGPDLTGDSAILRLITTDNYNSGTLTPALELTDGTVTEAAGTVTFKFEMTEAESDIALAYPLSDCNFVYQVLTNTGTRLVLRVEGAATIKPVIDAGS
jgi:hypothetical protein